MKNLRKIMYGSVISLLVINIVYTMEDQLQLSQENIIARLINAQKNSVYPAKPFLGYETFQFFRKYKQLNIAYCSCLTNENNAEEAIAYTKSKSAPGLLEWRILPTTNLAGLDALLLKHNFITNGTSSAMIYYLNQGRPTRFFDSLIAIQPLNIDEVSGWTHVLASSFECSWYRDHVFQNYIQKSMQRGSGMVGDTEYYAGYFDGKLIATGSLYLGEDCGYLFALGTDEHMRNKGFGTQMVMSILERAEELGLSCLILECDASAESFYTRLGFKKAFEMKRYRCVIQDV